MKCCATTKAGKACKKNAVDGEYCSVHGKKMNVKVDMEDQPTMQLSHEVLLGLERRVAFLQTPTGNAEQDECNQELLAYYSSSNSSDIQEKKLVEALGGAHKGEKKLGEDGNLEDGTKIEAKPCKSNSSVSAVNITDDQPSRLLKDLRDPTHIVVFGRCPGGLKFRWVVACLLSDFAESRYLAMCKHWNHPPEQWPSTVEDQTRVVQALAEKRTKNNYMRSSQLKFKDIKTMVAAWVHPDVEASSLTRKAEDEIIQRIWRIQTSVPPTASSPQVSQDLAE
jgi:hypothetical protein